MTELQISAGLSAEDRRFLQMAGDVLAGQTQRIVAHWRSDIIAGIPHLARHSRTPGGYPLPDYLAASNRRFDQWILDSCFRPYAQESAIRELMNPPAPKRRGIGFTANIDQKP